MDDKLNERQVTLFGARIAKYFNYSVRDDDYLMGRKIEALYHTFLLESERDERDKNNGKSIK
jgi:hypothetical protein